MSYFSWKSIQTAINTFGSCFENIFIERIDSKDSVIQFIKVPIMYSNKDKHIQRYIRRGIDSNDINDVIKTTLPRMGFEWIGDLYYDTETKRNRLNKTYGYNDINDTNFPLDLSTPISEFDDYPIESYTKDYVFSLYERVPYILRFKLYIINKKQIDSDNILEQILPNFTPELYRSVKYVFAPEEFTNPFDYKGRIEFVLDTPIVLKNVKREHIENTNFDKESLFIDTLEFSMRVWFFKNIKKEKIIKNIIVNLLDYQSGEKMDGIESAVAPTTENTIINLERHYDYFYNDMFQDQTTIDTSRVLYDK